MRGTHGYDPYNGYGGAITVLKHTQPGAARVANNTLLGGNSTGIFVRDDYHVLIRDNLLEDFTGKTPGFSGEGIHIISGIPVAVVSNTVRDCDIGIRVRRGTGHDLTRNTLENLALNRPTIGLYLSDTYGLVGANVHDNNTFSGFTYGVFLGSTSVALADFTMEWNDVTGTPAGGQAFHVEGTLPGPDYFHAECNWWGHWNGPDDDNLGPPDYWNNDPGQDVGDYFYFRDPSDNIPYWLDQPPLLETECSP